MKQISTGRDARIHIRNGVDKALETIAPTLGPEGRTAIVPGDFAGYHSTDDGLTVARTIELEGFEDVGAAFAREIALGMEQQSGDGRTTGCVIFQKLVHGLSDVSYSSKLRTEIKAAEEMAVKILTSYSISVEPKDLDKIATSASLDPEAGKVIGDALRKIGLDGQITVEPNDKPGLTLELVSGMTLDAGFANPGMINDSRKGTSEASEPFVFVTNQSLSKQEHLLPLLQKLETAGIFKLVVICDQMEADALALACVLTQTGKFTVVGVPTRQLYGDKKAILEDVAALTGAKLITEASAIAWDKIMPHHLGQAKKVIAGKDSTLIVDGAGTEAAIKGRVDWLKMDLKQAPEATKEALGKRIANLLGGVAVIHLGVPTANEYRVKCHKIEDAISATKAALQEGVIIGGGAALAKISTQLPDTEGGRIVAKALTAPLMQMADNIGIDANEVLSQVRLDKPNMNPYLGWDFKENRMTDMMKSGIVDPLKVVKAALAKAISTSLTFATTESIIINKIEDGQNKG